MNGNRGFAKFATEETVFDEPNEASDSLRDGADEMFGRSAPGSGISTGRQVARPISIFDIWPDMAQPRRAMPSAARYAWDGDPHNLRQAFDAWLTLAEDEAGVEIDLRGIIEGGLSEEQLPALPDEATLAESFVKLAALAASIQQEGLTNPITIVEHGQGYQIETGERRWLAYHLLYCLTDGKKWSKIPARAVDAFNIWRQAAENNTRADLNAIGKARQFALLLMELLRVEGHQFQPFQAFGYEAEQVFYAQVADGDMYRVPRGKGEMLLAAMGLKNGRQLRDYRALLRLPPELWVLADDENWTEFRIRQEVSEDTVPTGTVSDNPIVSQPGKKPPALSGNGASYLIPPEAGKAWKYVATLEYRRRAGEEYQDALGHINYLRSLLDEAERKLRGE